jgi:hypothetical protein
MTTGDKFGYLFHFPEIFRLGLEGLMAYGLWMGRWSRVHHTYGDSG